MPDAPQWPVQHSVGPRCTRVTAAGHGDLPIMSASQPGEAQFFTVPGHVELLVRRRPRDGLVPSGVQGGGEGGRIGNPGEPVDIDVIAHHLAEEEIHAQPPRSHTGALSCPDKATISAVSWT